MASPGGDESGDGVSAVFFTAAGTTPDPMEAEWAEVSVERADGTTQRVVVRFDEEAPGLVRGRGWFTF